MNEFEVMMQEELIMDAANNAVMMAMPNGKFFIPNKVFWATLLNLKEAYKFTFIIDAGCGDGHVSEEARDYKLKMVGCDIFRREERDIETSIQYVPAHRLVEVMTGSSDAQDTWVMVCRPDHSGWVAPLYYRTQIERNMGFIYVGDSAKLMFDVDPERLPDYTVDNVGEDSESMFIWFPT